MLPKDHFKDKPLLSKIDIHCDILGNLGNNYYSLGEMEKAIRYYEKALEITQEIGDKRNKGRWIGCIGLAYRALGEMRKAIEYHEKALKIAQEIGDRQNEGKSLGNLGAVYYDLSEWKRAIDYYEAAREDCSSGTEK